MIPGVREDYNRPSSRARATASVRLWTWSLSKIFRLCPLTVLRARKSRSLISLIRESLGNELEDFQLALAQWLDQGLGRRGRDDLSSRFCASASNAASSFPI